MQYVIGICCCREANVANELLLNYYRWQPTNYCIDFIPFDMERVPISQFQLTSQKPYLVEWKSILFVADACFALTSEHFPCKHIVMIHLPFYFTSHFTRTNCSSIRNGPFFHIFHLKGKTWVMEYFQYYSECIYWMLNVAWLRVNCMRRLITLHEI